MSDLKVDRIQLGQNGTATQNFTFKQGADGTLTLARGNAGATTQDLLTIDASGNVQLTKATTQSMIRVNTANGYGSTNTKIRRFTNTVTSQGTDITYTDSSTDGASFTINTDGVYAINNIDTGTAGLVTGISLNSSELTTNIQSITVADILAFSRDATSETNTPSTTVFLQAGDVIRPHNDGGANDPTYPAMFTITRVA